MQTHACLGDNRLCLHGPFPVGLTSQITTSALSFLCRGWRGRGGGGGGGRGGGGRTTAPNFRLCAKCYSVKKLRGRAGQRLGCWVIGKTGTNHFPSVFDMNWGNKSKLWKRYKPATSHYSNNHADSSRNTGGARCISRCLRRYRAGFS